MSKQLGNLMRQAQKMQEKVAEIQKDLATKTVEASSGGGMVIATVNGKNELVALKVDPGCVDPNDVEMLQDLIVAAVNEAHRKSQQLQAEEMGKITQGMGLNLPPGLF